MRVFAAIALAAGLIASPALAKPVDTAVEIAVPGGVLKGALLAPEAGPRGPAVLIIAGSGPTDRDGNSPLGVSAQPYRLLAEALADRGITSLRYDKRGIGASATAMAREEDLRFTTYADDARAWAADLKTRTGATCVWLAGHSEGALIAEVAAQKNKDVCGVILISGAGRPAIQVIREQFQAGPAANLAAITPVLDAWEAGKTAACPPGFEPICRPSVQPYILSWAPLDPAALIKTVPGRVLILQGTTDLQVSVADAERLAAARPDARFVKLEGVNHVLKVAPADPAANGAAYRDPTLPLAPGIADEIAAFVKARH